MNQFLGQTAANLVIDVAGNQTLKDLRTVNALWNQEYSEAIKIQEIEVDPRNDDPMVKFNAEEYKYAVENLRMVY